MTGVVTSVSVSDSGCVDPVTADVIATVLLGVVSTPVSVIAVAPPTGLGPVVGVPDVPTVGCVSRDDVDAGVLRDEGGDVVSGSEGVAVEAAAALAGSGLSPPLAANMTAAATSTITMLAAAAINAGDF